jgi:DNA topoisomerase-2
MIFGHLLTGSNFDDDNDQRFGGGRNGFGAKLANILSTKFSVECGDSENKKHFYMCWTNNMGDSKMPVIKDYKKKDFV